MSEPLGQKRQLRSNVSSEASDTAFDKPVKEMLGMPSKKELSENDPDKVVRGWNPNEGRRLRAYHYYIQRLDGKTPLWNEMINQLKQDGRNQITGAIFKDDTVVWSDEGIVHESLIRVANGTEEQRGIIGVFQSRYEPGQANPRLTIYCDDPNGTKFADYLRRNIDPKTSLSVWAAPGENHPRWVAHELSIRSS